MRLFRIVVDVAPPPRPDQVITMAGHVADGVWFDDGAVVIRWHRWDGHPVSTVVWEDGHGALAAHESGGARVEWVNPPTT